MIILDTSLLVDALTGARRSAPALRDAFESGEMIRITMIVLYEWLRGPRSAQEIGWQENLFPSGETLSFELDDATLSAHFYRTLRRPRGREADFTIAATAIRHQAHLWTLNTADFTDIPGLSLWRHALAL